MIAPARRGIAGACGERAAELRPRLGAEARLLPAEGPALIVDAGPCWLDGARLNDDAKWISAIRNDALRRIDGAFALAYRNEAGTLHLARDPIGHRSLYFAAVAGTLVFASRLQAIVASGFVPAEIDPAGLAAYLSCAYVPGAGTLVRGVQALRGGEAIRFRDGSLERRWYWRLPAEPAIAESESELLPRLRASLAAAVDRRLPEASAIGATLSGGIDSSAVVALLRRRYDGPLTVYSVSFGPEHRNELEFSGLVAKHCGVEQRVVELSPARILDDLDPTMAALSEPNGDPLTVPNSYLFRAAREQSPVLFNGEGGDPCFGGPKNAPMLLAELLGHGPDTPGSRAQDYLRAHLKCFDELPELLGPELRDAAASELEDELTIWFDDPRWPSFLNKLMAINVVWKGAHHILPKVEQLSARFGVEPASPLFDRELVELAFAIPGTLKRQGAEEKYLFKRAVAELLPPAIVDRPKSGMLVPVEAWFQGPLLPEARQRLLDGLRPWRLFDPAWLERLLDGSLAGLRPRRGVKVWLLVALESWLRSLRTR